MRVTEKGNRKSSARKQGQVRPPTDLVNDRWLAGVRILTHG